MESILDLVKKSVGIDPSYTEFDPDIIMHINSVFMILRQMGVGPKEGYRIEDNKDLWEDFLPFDDPNHDGVKTYIGAKVRMAFDPPTSSSLMEALKQVISEFEWRLNFEAELNTTENATL